MAVTTQSLVLRWGRDLEGAALGYGTDTAVEGIRLGLPVRPEAWADEWVRGVRLPRGVVSGDHRTFLRRVGGMSSWGPGEIVVRGNPAQVQFRLTDGVKEYRWAGGAWAEATPSQWSPIEDAWAGLPTWDKPVLGWVFHLWRTKATDDSPVVFGAKAVCRILFAQTVADDRRAASWLDDLVHRVFLDRALEELQIAGAHEVEVGSEFESLDYAQGVSDWPYDVTGIEAVFDVTADPRLRSPLAGAWDSNDRTWTPAVPPPEGHVLHSRFVFRPDVAYTGQRDFVTTRLPAVLVEQAEPAGGRRQGGDEVVRSLTTNEAVLVGRPKDRTYRLSGRAVAARTTDAQRMADALERWLGDGPISVLSPTTSLPVVLQLEGTPAPGPVVGDAADIRFTIRAEVEEWHGREMSGITLKSGGLDVRATAKED